MSSTSPSSSPSTFNTNTNTNLSIYIPRVFHNITEERIMNCFKTLNIGVVSRVDLVDRESDQNDDKTRMAFIHFKSWSDSLSSKNLREKILNPQEVAKIVYDDPYYWILLPNKNPKSEDQIKNEVMFSHQAKQITSLIERVKELEDAMKNRDESIFDQNEELREFLLSPGVIESSGTSSMLENAIYEEGDGNDDQTIPEWNGVTNEDIVESPLTMSEIVQDSEQFETETTQERSAWWPSFWTSQLSNNTHN